MKLRFGVMCTGEWLESGFAASLDELLRIDGVELALLIVDVTPPARSSLMTKLKRMVSLNGNLWAIYRRLSPLRRRPCYRPRDMSVVFAGVPRIRCRVARNGRFSQYFHPEDLERIRGFNLDFILRFAFGIIRGDILQAARYGVWSFHHDDESRFRGSPPGFWELYYGEPTTGAILQRLVDRLDAGIVLQKCHIQSRRWSYAANLNAIVWAAVHMPARVCRDILDGRAQYLEAAPSRTQAPIYRPPSDLQMVRFLIRTWSIWVKRQIEFVLFVEDWNIGVVRGPVESFLKPQFRPRVTWLADSKRNTFWADPFVHSIAADEKKLLLEEFDYASDRGVIVEMDLDENGVAKAPPRPAIDDGVHMAYPYLIEHKGQMYCVPESWQGRNVSLYALNGHRQWHVVSTIIDAFPAVDPTLFHHQGLWWLWCTHREDEPNSKLFLWYAPDLFGPWTPHPGNPVKVDVRSSRPAGSPFVSEGTLYRPAQDCSHTYGGGITINRVTHLSPREFCEEPVTYIEPWDSRYRAGIHTLAGNGCLTVLDGKRMVLGPTRIQGRLGQKLRRLGHPARDCTLERAPGGWFKS